MGNERLKLVEPTMDYERELKNYRNEFIVHGGSMDGCTSLREMENILDWIELVEKLKKRETCPEHLVPMTQFIYVREADNKIVGVIQVRHCLNEYLKNYGGHIGYSVCHSERRKGYATRMLEALLPKCREIGLDKVMITCLEDNEGSRRTILNNGGIFENTVFEPGRGVHLERYWITL